MPLSLSEAGAAWFSCLKKSSSCVKDASITTEHHDQNASTQTTFVEKVGALQRVLKELGNPFQEETADLLVLDPKTIADPTL